MPLLSEFYNVLALSGGKDSLATAILDHFYNGHQINEVIYVEVMYDRTRNISAEPLMADFVRKKAKPVLESWGYKVTILRSESHDYLTYFNHEIKNAKNPENEGKRAGFPLTGLCSIKRDCKEKPMRQYLKSLKSIHGNFLRQYVGICSDELSRLESLHKCKNKRSLLNEFGYTQKDARALTEEYDLLSPTYGLSRRSGCFFCPWCKVSEFAYMKENFPEIWAEFVALEDQKDLASNRWNIFKHTLKELDSLI